MNIKTNFNLQRKIYFELTFILIALNFIFWLDNDLNLTADVVPNKIIYGILIVQLTNSIIQLALHQILKKEFNVCNRALLVMNLCVSFLYIILVILDINKILIIISLVYTIIYLLVGTIKYLRPLVLKITLTSIEVDEENTKDLRKNRFFSKKQIILYRSIMIIDLFVFYMSIRNINSLKSKILLSVAILILLTLDYLIYIIGKHFVISNIRLLEKSQNKNIVLKEFIEKENLNEKNKLFVLNFGKEIIKEGENIK